MLIFLLFYRMLKKRKMSSLPKVILAYKTHRKELKILIRFDYNQTLIDQLKVLPIPIGVKV